MDERGPEQRQDPFGGAEQSRASGAESLRSVEVLALRVSELERRLEFLEGSRTESAARTPPKPREDLGSVQQSTLAPPPAPPAVLTNATADVLGAGPAKMPRKSLEDRVGAQGFNMVGIVALIVGAAYGLKLAIEHGYLGPIGRVVICLVAGAALIVWSATFRKKGLPAFSYSLKAVGSVVLYLSLWAAFHLYALLPAGVALASMLMVTAWIAFMAWREDAELLAGYALAGGLATPLLLSTGGDHEAFLFTYLTAIDIATVLLIRRKPWPRLLIPSFLATVGYFAGWYAAFFHALSAHDSARAWDAQSTETAAFVALFVAVFALASVRGWQRQGKGTEADSDSRIEAIFLPLANAVFVGAALYSVFEDSGQHAALSWLMAGLGAVFLGLMRIQRTSLAAAIHLAAAVIFLTIAIPLKASGHTLTTAWLVEGLVLYWASTRFERGQDAPSRVLFLLSAGGFTLGLLSLFAHWFFFGMFYAAPPSVFFSSNLGAALVAVAALAGAVWLAVQQAAGAPRRELVPWAALAAITLVGLLLALKELGIGSSTYPGRAAFANAEFSLALVGLVVLGGAAYAGYFISREASESSSAASRFLPAATFALFNLLAIGSVEREIGSLWSKSDANLQRSLAISAFLMLYGAVLLAAGFLRRSAFTRWQALILLTFTIAKVFLYDVSGLSQGYRVVSLLGLGAVLMGVSLAYQKDWLGLRIAAAEKAIDA